MDPVTLATSLAIGAASAGASSLIGGKPPKPDIPQPVKPPEQPAAKPRQKTSMQDSFLTGVAGMGVADKPRGKTLLGE